VVPDDVDALEWLRKRLDAEGSDLLREMVRTFAERLMGGETAPPSRASSSDSCPGWRCPTPSPRSTA
jgi:hypothetical protein